MKISMGPFFNCSPGAVTAVCSLGSHLLRVFIYDARGFLDPFLAFLLRLQPNKAAACYVIRRLMLPSGTAGRVGIL